MTAIDAAVPERLSVSWFTGDYLTSMLRFIGAVVVPKEAPLPDQVFLADGTDALQNPPRPGDDTYEGEKAYKGNRPKPVA